MGESLFGRRELKLVLVVVLGTLLIGAGMLLTVRLNEAIDEWAGGSWRIRFCHWGWSGLAEA